MIIALNLDKDFKPTTLNEIEYVKMRFSGGESHIKLDQKFDYSNVEKVVITNRFVDGNSIMEVLIAKDALEYYGIKKFDLIMPYVPYARQDRRCDDGESFTLKVFVQIINSANFDTVMILDAHSDVAPALLNNCVNIPSHEYINKMLNSIYEDKFHLISIDAGSSKKIDNLGKFLHSNGWTNFDIIQCHKKRNVSNGKIEGFESFCDDLNNIPCIICDDIADGGSSFIYTAKELKNKNAGDLYLFVTHGIFSCGTEELMKYYKKVYTTNSFKDIDDELITQFEIKINY